MIKARGKQLHPGLALLAAATVFFVGLLFVRQAAFPYFLLFLILLYLLSGFGKVMLKSAWLILPLAALMFGLTLINGTLQDALNSFWRFVLLGLAAVTTVTMEPIRLVRWMNQIRLPRWISLGLLITLRFFAILKEELRRIVTAVSLRGISFFRSPLLYLRALVLPLMIRILSISELLSLSLETRGFSMEGESSAYETIRFEKADGVFAFFFFGGFAFFAYLFFIRGGEV